MNNEKEKNVKTKNTKPTEVKVGQVWRDLDDRTPGERYIVVVSLTGHGGFRAARCASNGCFLGIERRYQTAAFLRRVGHKSGFALHKDAP